MKFLFNACTVLRFIILILRTHKGTCICGLFYAATMNINTVNTVIVFFFKK